MTTRAKTIVAAMAAGVLTCAGAAAKDAPLWATPEGITVQPLGLAQGYGLDQQTASLLARNELVYADVKGMTLYTSAADTPGRSSCAGDCARTWQPMIAATTARPYGGWSLIVRDDGARQWALGGKALYTYVSDADPGSVAGNSPARFGRGPNVGPRGALKGPKPVDAPMPEGWAPALLFPHNDIALPPGLAVKEVADAMGLVLVSSDSRTIYVSDANRKASACAGACRTLWQPVPAAQLAEPIGDFGFVVRDDGVKQWTYKGRPLFTYGKDFSSGDYANGAGIDGVWHPAYIARYFHPTNVTVQPTLRLGKVLATQKGMTLYRRDALIFQSGGGFGTRRGYPVRPAVGRDIGANPRCAGDCLKVWHPFPAPADAQPSGEWNILVREDGSRQWTYQGHALWTYDGDTHPGDAAGEEIFDLVMSDDAHTVVDIGTPYDGPTALYWTVAIP